MDFANFAEGNGNGNGFSAPGPVHVNESGLLDVRADHVAQSQQQSNDLPLTQRGTKSDDVVLGI